MPKEAVSAAQLSLPVENDDSALIAKLRKQLADPQWDFHTVEGLAERAGVAPAAVKRILKENPKLVRYVPATKGGRQLYVDGSRPRRGKALRVTLRGYLAQTILRFD